MNKSKFAKRYLSEATYAVVAYLQSLFIYLSYWEKLAAYVFQGVKPKLLSTTIIYIYEKSIR